MSIASLPGMKERSIVLNGFSKSMAMTGWRLGYIAAPEYMIEPMNRLSFYMTAGATTFVQYAGVAGLLEEDGSIERMRQEFKHRRDYLVEEINKLVGSDTLGYLSIEHVQQLAIHSQCGFCTGCFTGKYPVDPPDETMDIVYDKPLSTSNPKKKL